MLPKEAAQKNPHESADFLRHFERKKYHQRPLNRPLLGGFSDLLLFSGAFVAPASLVRRAVVVLVIAFPPAFDYSLTCRSTQRAFYILGNCPAGRIKYNKLRKLNRA